MSPPIRAELAQLKGRLVETLPDAERATLELRAGVLHLRAGEQDQALLHVNAARRGLDALGDRRRAAQADALAGTICALKGEHDRAATLFDRARQAAATQEDPDLLARIANQAADAASARGDYEDARVGWATAREHFERYWDGAELSRAYGGLAATASDLGDADRLSEKGVEEAEAAGDPLWLGRALRTRAQVRWRMQDLRGAKRFFRRAISLLSDHDLRRELAETYLAHALFVGEATVDSPEAFTDPPAFWLAKAQELFREVGSLRDLERVRDGFRKHGRRATDRIAEAEVHGLLAGIKRAREEVGRHAQRLADRVHAAVEGDQELADTESALAKTLVQLAKAEDQFVGALNTVILERENIRTLLELCRSLAAIQDYARLPQDIARMAAQLTGADRAVVALVGDDGLAAPRATVRLAAEDAGAWRQIVEGAAGPGSTPRLIPRDGDRAGRLEDSGARHRLSSDRVRLGGAMACPLRHGERVFGAIYVDKELCGGVFTERELDLLSVFAAQVTTIVENTRVAEELRIAARTRAAMLEAISDGVVSMSKAGRVTGINATATRMLGLGTADVGALSIDGVPELVFLGQCMARGEELDARVVRLASGDHLLNARLVRGDAGDVIGMVATLTEMKRATSLAQRIVGSTARFTFGDIIGRSPVLRRRLQLAEAAARSDSSVLVTGESGTGKELLAQAIHNAGTRSSGPFVALNCAAIPRELLESELFGYETGAFTGAKKGGHPGKFELADAGTILLDEIGDMPLEMQAKLLRVLQEKRLSRLGGTREIPLNTRVIATTNRDLAEEVERGRFRQDLFFRLRVIHIELPPLRERPDDIPVLVDHFLQLFAARLDRSVRDVAPDVMRALVTYQWPGNIRELEHVLEGEVNMAAQGQETLTEVPLMLTETRARGAAGSSPRGVSSIAENERQLLLAALTEHHGSVPDVARALGVSRGTVYNKMRKFQIDPAVYRGPG